MNRYLPLVLVALITFVLVWFFLRFAAEEPGRIRGSGSPFVASSRDPVEDQVRDPVDHEGVVTRHQKLEGPKASLGRGALVVRAQLPGGRAPEVFEVSARPALPEPLRLDGSLHYGDIPAGSYEVSIHGEDLIPVVQRAVVIKAGEETDLLFKVVRGIHLKGVVLDAEDESPLAGVRIDFNGVVRTVSGPDGRFDVPQLMPRRCLDVIRLEGDRYDFQTYRGLLVPDPGDLRLMLGGGKGVLFGQINNASGQALPGDAYIQMTLPPLYDLRRRLPLEGMSSFRLENLYPGQFRIELHCPGGEFPMISQVVQIPEWQSDRLPEARVELTVTAGTRFEGRLIGSESHLAGLRFELRDIRNQVVAATRVGEQLDFRFANLEPGAYYPVLRMQIEEQRMPVIEIQAGQAVMQRNLDVGRRRWLP